MEIVDNLIVDKLIVYCTTTYIHTSMETSRLACTPSLGKERIETTEALALRQKGITKHIRYGRKRNQSRSEAIAHYAKGLNVLKPFFSLALSLCLSLSLLLYLSCSFYPAARLGGGGWCFQHIFAKTAIHTAADGHGA